MAKSSRPDPFSDQQQEQQQESAAIEGADKPATEQPAADPPDLKTPAGVAAYLEKQMESANNMSKAEIMGLISGCIAALKKE